MSLHSASSLSLVAQPRVAQVHLKSMGMLRCGVGTSWPNTYYLRISSTNVITPFDFILCNGSLRRDFHNPWPYILQLDSIWSPVSLSLVHINLEIPYLSLELDLVLLVSRGKYIIKIRKFKYHCAALPKACTHLVMFLVKFAKACISTAKRVFPHLPSIPPPVMQCRIEWLWAFWDLAKEKLNWTYI